MKTLRLAVLSSALACTAILPHAAGAKNAPQKPASSPELPSVTYKGKQPVQLRYGEISVTLDTEPGSQPAMRVPTFKGIYQGRPIFTLRIEEAEDTEPQTGARVVRLDAKTAVPQIVMTAYTGGAHCCTVTKIAIAVSADKWEIIDGPLLDGDRGYLFYDADRDGTDELVSVDQNFLYGFACYACSSPPTRIAKLDGTKIVDVTFDPKYRNFLRRELADMEKEARKDPSQWHENGFLAGWVAAKSAVGEVDEAWRRMLASYDRKADWPLQECTTGEPVEKCPEDKLRDLTFPQALLKQLAVEGYPTPKSAR
jgi:hypothetical protein